MNESPEISIIVPIYNQEKYIGKCIRSVLCQSLHNIEVILVNDGSTDRSLSICKKYEEKDGRVIIVNKQNEGVVKARKDGLLRACGEFVFFIDGDDYIPSEACEMLFKIACEKKVDLVVGGYDFVYDNWGIVKRDKAPYMYSERLIEGSEVLKLMLGFDYREECTWGAQMWGRLYRRSCIMRAIASDEEVLFPSHRKLEDFKFNLSMAFFIRSMWISNSIVYHYRYGGITNKAYLVLDRENCYFDYRYERCIKHGYNDVLPMAFSCYLKFFCRDVRVMLHYNICSKSDIESYIDRELTTRKIVLWAQKYMNKPDGNSMEKAIICRDTKKIMDIALQDERKRWRFYIKKRLLSIYQNIVDVIAGLAR